jgi:hypothetical protein
MTRDWSKNVAVKLLMTWDIIPGREQDYFEFVVRDFIPGMQRLGLEPSDAWFTMYGEQPQIMTGAQMPSLSALERTLASTEWQSLVRQLSDYVEEYKFKIVSARPGFQI